MVRILDAYDTLSWCWNSCFASLHYYSSVVINIFIISILTTFIVPIVFTTVYFYIYLFSKYSVTYILYPCNLILATLLYIVLIKILVDFSLVKWLSHEWKGQNGIQWDKYKQITLSDKMTWDSMNISLWVSGHKRITLWFDDGSEHSECGPATIRWVLLINSQVIRYNIIWYY